MIDDNIEIEVQVEHLKEALVFTQKARTLLEESFKKN